MGDVLIIAVVFFIIGTVFGWSLRGCWINRVPAHLECRECGTLIFHIPRTACPYCNSEKGYIMKTGKVNEG